VVESLWASRELGLNRFVSEQPPYHPLDRRIERELIPMARTYGIGLIPWSPLAGGLLTGKYKRDDMSAEGRWQGGRQGPEWRQTSDAAFDIIERIEQIAADKNASPSQAALAWNMAQPGITSPIIGPRTMEQLEDNLGAVDVEWTDADNQRIDEVARPGSVTVRYYEANFGPHESRIG
jgi:aryl-alcohol dehydrogenase-like predicted oxidoreductase